MIQIRATQARSSVQKGRNSAEKPPLCRAARYSPLVYDVKTQLDMLDNMVREVVLMRINQDYGAPDVFVPGIKELLDTH